MGRIRRAGERAARFFRKSVKRAFAFYALAAAIAGMLLSLVVVGALTGIADEIWSEESGATGVYIYDEERDALVPAERLSWRGHSVSLYYENTYVNPKYFPSISLQDPPRDVDLMHIVDDSYDIVVFGPSAVPLGGDESSQCDLSSVAAYDRQMNEERGGNADELASEVFGALQEDAPLTSLVGYYIYFEPSMWYVAVNVASVALIPVIVLACMLVAARTFYRRHLQEPVAIMNDAAQRIALGDLDFNVACHEGGNELDRLCVSFEAMRNELATNERRMWREAESRRRANAALAHDLRTPLTVIKGQAEILAILADGESPDARRVRDASEAINRQAARLEGYASSMRDLEAIGATEQHVTPVSLAKWFAQVSSDASEVARNAGVRLEARYGGACDDLRDVLGCEADDGGCEKSHDEAREMSLASAHDPACNPAYIPATGAELAVLMDTAIVERVIDNLVANAARFAREAVRLAATWDSDVLVIRVRDDGPGFTDEALCHAREAYWRASDNASGECSLRDNEASSGGASGMSRHGNAESAALAPERASVPHFGLGLNIASVLCEKHGGALTLGNAPEGGAVVEATFAAARETSLQDLKS